MKLFAVLAVTSAALVVAAAAFAGAPVQTGPVTTTVSTPNPANPYPRCTNYGYAFNGAVTFTVTRRSTLFYDDAGNLVEEIRHVQFEGLVHKSTDLSVTIPYAASFTSITDFAAGTVTITGLFRTSHPDGSGVFAIASGRRVLSLATNAELEPPTGNPPIEWEQAICAYLAGA